MDSNQDNEITDEYDKEFINLLMGKIVLISLLEIEKQTAKLKKHDQLRVKSWCKKLCQVTNNIEWKKNRNLHAICLLDNVLNERFEEPYNKFAPEGAIPIINKTIVKSKLSPKFLRSTISMQNQNVNVRQDRSYQPSQKKENSFNRSIKQKETDININISNIRAQNDNEQLKTIISQLQNEGKKKDSMIQKLKEDKMKMEKRIQELEKMLSSFMEMEK